MFWKKKTPVSVVKQEEKPLVFADLHGALEESVSKEQEERLKEGIFYHLAWAMKTGHAGSPEGQYVAALHRKWICLFWREGMYTKDAHLTLANIYVADRRFAAFYDGRVGSGGAQFLRDAIEIYVYRGGAVLDEGVLQPSKALPSAEKEKEMAVLAASLTRLLKE